MRIKILSLITVFIMSLTIPVFAADIDVQPTMLSRSNEQNRVWAGTLQIAWNELIDKYVRSVVRFREGTPIPVRELNQKTFSADSLSGKSYYKYTGDITKNTAKNIEKSVAKKFKETSDILGSLNPTSGTNSFLIYVMLKKDFEFLKEFDKLGTSAFGKDATAEYFGIDNNSKNEIKEAASVLYYNSPDDFAVKLLTKDKDEVFLYKNSANKEFKRLYRDMTYKSLKYGGQTTLGKDDELKVPNIKFDVTKSFDELCNKRIMGTNTEISQVLETIKFNMDNKGVQLKNETTIVTQECACPDEETEKPVPRYFYLDNTFVIFLKEKDRSEPYFALRVNDISKFQ